MSRRANLERSTKETQITCTIDLDGSGDNELSTGIGFLDHMLDSLARHAGFDLSLRCTGDLHISDHHTAEDCALVLGGTIDKALGERKGIGRFGSALVPMDEALARAAIDLSGRPSAHIDLGLRRQMLGTIASENLTHVLASLSLALRCALHVDVLKGENDHHRCEAAFKATALCLRQAVALDGSDRVPSTKEVL